MMEVSLKLLLLMVFIVVYNAVVIVQLREAKTQIEYLNKRMQAIEHASLFRFVELDDTCTQ